MAGIEKAMERLEDSLNEYIEANIQPLERTDCNYLFTQCLKFIDKWFNDGEFSDELEGCLVWTEDCEHIVSEYGIAKSLRMYRDIHGAGEYPFIENLAKMVLWNTFSEKWNGLNQTKLAIEFAERYTEVHGE